MLLIVAFAEVSPANLLKSNSWDTDTEVGWVSLMACLLKAARLKDSVLSAIAVRVDFLTWRLTTNSCSTRWIGESSGFMTTWSSYKADSLCSRLGFFKTMITCGRNSSSRLLSLLAVAIIFRLYNELKRLIERIINLLIIFSFFLCWSPSSTFPQRESRSSRNMML